MNDLLFIRHAETDMTGTFCGQSDPTVNAAGHRQIQKLAEPLRTEPIVTVFTSDLQRSVTTARALALCGLDEKTAWALTKAYCCTFRYAHHPHPDKRLQEVLG